MHSEKHLILIAAVVLYACAFTKEKKVNEDDSTPVSWSPPDSTKIMDEASGELILYGKDLIAHTAKYLGPRGVVGAKSNGMNCQNCHLKAGTKIFGNNYSAVASMYPRYRDRSGTIENIEKRVNDCLERSLNGQALQLDSREMKAFVKYLSWVGKDVPKDQKPHGSGLKPLAFLDRPADPENGKVLFDQKCVTCHGKNGEGLRKADSIEWVYPPLWGPNSYNDGAGLYRIAGFASFIKANMPLGATYNNPALTDEEAWDIAAFVNSMERPHKDTSKDWPDISKKPIDHPFGPFVDGFGEHQHKYGPFAEIVEARKKVSK